MLKLRDYQQEAVDSIYRYFSQKSGNPLVVIPTAGGKALILSTFTKSALEARPDQRILILTHVKELIAQNHAEMLGLWPEAPAGIYSAGLGKRDLDAKILFGGIQSLHKKAQALGHVDLVLVDEAHLIPNTSSTMYRKFLSELTAINPYLKVIGFTATPYRSNSGRLHEGKDALFTDIAYEVEVSTLIEQGYLCPLTSKKPATVMDVKGVRSNGGDFVAKDLAAAVDQDAITKAVVSEMVTLGQNRKSWLAFCASVSHAKNVATELHLHGISCATIFGDTPGDVRDRILRDFKAGKIRALASMGVLTTGFNAPNVDLIALLRPTTSTGLYVQMVGRGARLAPGKENCLVLDFAGNVRRHGPIDDVEVYKPSNVQGQQPSKVCSACDSIVGISVRVCPDCGQEFEFAETDDPDLDTKADDTPILSGKKRLWVPVEGIRYSRHQKPGGYDTFKVSYSSGLNLYHEWICFDHPGYPRQKAEQWWERHAPGEPIPMSVSEALTQLKYLRLPTEILIRPKGRFIEIRDYRFGACPNNQHSTQQQGSALSAAASQEALAGSTPSSQSQTPGEMPAADTSVASSASNSSRMETRP